jgi:UDPglucose 6-dehydrogenase
MITVGIWGCGVVGSNTARMFKELGKKRVKVLMYDKYKQGDFCSKQELIDNSHFIFICLPTPMNDNGSVNLDYIHEALEEINKVSINRPWFQPIVIRSTITPGSCNSFAEKYRELNIAFIPEFLVESDPWTSTVKATRVIIGVDSEMFYYILETLFRSVYPLGEVKFIRMKREEAEMYKYACNTLLAMNVMTANEIYLICEKAGIDYGVIQRNLKLDSRIGTHTLVPGPDGDLGIGGKCLPKDVNALCHYAETVGYSPSFIKEGLNMNERIRKEMDWMNIPGAVSSCGYEEKGE